MTSQKRFRQHHESNNSSARFRDLPPRFKRQKSSTSTASDSLPTTPLETQNNNTSDYSPVTKRIDSQESIPSPAGISPSSNVYLHEENHASQLRTRTHILPTQVGVSNSAALQLPQKINGALVLSPWDSRHFDKVNNIQPQHVPLGTHFGFKPDSPPLSPWASTSISEFPIQHRVTNSPPWKSSHSDPCPSQSMQSSSGYYRNENWAPTPNFLRSPDTVWSKSTSQECINSASPPIRSHTSLPAKQSEKRNEVKTYVKDVIDYSDPDIRTIEMLRELERVADQKESECNDFGVDRKSLVSHHLRMLMCAVDRYTEGIEDFTVASRCDEVTTSDSPRNSPGPDEIWQQKQIKEVTKVARSEQGIPQWSPNLNTSAWKNPAINSVSPMSNQLTVPTHGHEALFPSPQASPVWDNQSSMKSRENVAWDLWSSPSFDFSVVLESRNTEQLTRDPFGRFTEKDERVRKPLYQR